jgi:hypothetical protein
LTIDANTDRPARSAWGILVWQVTGNFCHELHDPSPHGGTRRANAAEIRKTQQIAGRETE